MADLQLRLSAMSTPKVTHPLTKRLSTGNIPSSDSPTRKGFTNTSCSLCDHSDESHWDDLWVGCEECDEWYHISCLNLTRATVLHMARYVCPWCTSSGNGFTKYYGADNYTDVPDRPDIDPDYRPGRPLRSGKKRRARTAPYPQVRGGVRARQVTSAGDNIEVPHSESDATSVAESEPAPVTGFGGAPFRPGLGKNAARVGNIVHVMPFGPALLATPGPNVAPAPQPDGEDIDDGVQTSAAADAGLRVKASQGEDDDDENDRDNGANQGPIVGFPLKPYRPGLGKNARRAGGLVQVFPYADPADEWTDGMNGQEYDGAMHRANGLVQRAR